MKEGYDIRQITLTPSPPLPLNPSTHHRNYGYSTGHDIIGGEGRVLLFRYWWIAEFSP